MRTVKQVSTLTGVSVRTLQFYDEIGLFKPTKITEAGYRLYDDTALEVLQQILFFKELDFTLKEIKTIMEDAQFDKATAFEKQRELIQMKRDRLNALLTILDKLIKGEKCMEFKEFDMSNYFRVLTNFKKTHTDDIISKLGSIESFDEMISDLKSNKSQIADMAVKQYGSLEDYTKAMEKNFQNFLSNGPTIKESQVSALIEKGEEITKRLTADLSKEVASPEVQKIVSELVAYTNEMNSGLDMGDHYWTSVVDFYVTNPLSTEVNDKKYGEGASQFIGLALKVYLDKTGRYTS